MIESFNQMLPGLSETPANKQRLYDQMTKGHVRFCPEKWFARKDLPGGRYSAVRVDAYKQTKRPRNGPQTVSWKFHVMTGIYRTEQIHPLHGVIYRAHVDDNKDALWTAVGEALKAQAGTPGNLCVHCRKDIAWEKTDTCPTCTFGLQSDHQAMEKYGLLAKRIADRKTPQPLPGLSLSGHLALGFCPH